MRDDITKKTSQERQGPAGPSRERRLLLKAAAAAAPLIATLPNGAALANASAAACVMNNKKLSAQGEVQEVVNPSADHGGEPSDSYVRYAAWQRICSGQAYYYVYAPSGAKWYRVDGVQADPTCNPAAPPIRGDRKVYVLTLWIPDDDFTGVHSAGFYPVNKLIGNNMGITASCLCSVDPGHGDPPHGSQSWCRA